MDSPAIFLGASLALLSIGLYCVSKPNMIRILLGVEMVLNSANLAFIYFSSMRASAVIVNAYKHYKTTDARELRRLRW